MNKNPFFKKTSDAYRGKSPFPQKAVSPRRTSLSTKKAHEKDNTVTVKRGGVSSFKAERNETSVYPHKEKRFSQERVVRTPNKQALTKVNAAQSSNKHKHAAKDDTSWGTVASWYNDHLEKGGDTYHEKVVYPNLLRIMGDVHGKKVLDLACGQGQFSRILRNEGAYVTGVDLGKELIAIAESHNVSVKEAGTHKVNYFHGSADDLYMIKDGTCDTVVCVLALQNIEKLQKTIEEVRRVLVKGGNFIFVLNHPSFRNPRKTHWGFHEDENIQYRRVDEYMSESHVKIDMTPGSATQKKFTVSFHRPLQVYVKALSKQGFAVTRLEEWVSHRASEKGPRQHAENISRKEIPLFMCIEGKVFDN